MKLAMMQPYFFPYLGYFQLISAVDTYILFDKLVFNKHGWVTRNRIKNHEQPPFYIFIPVHDSINQSIGDTEIVNPEYHKGKFLKTLRACYRRSPFFNESYPVFENAFNTSTRTIGEFNTHSLLCICRHLEIQTEIITDIMPFHYLEEQLESLYPNSSHDAENELPKKVKRLLLFCEAFQSRHYVNAIGGTAMYSKKVFGDHGVTLSFINTLPYSYPQGGKEFEPDLSIIDVMMNCGKARTMELLHHYTLI